MFQRTIPLWWEIAKGSLIALAVMISTGALALMVAMRDSWKRWTGNGGIDVRMRDFDSRLDKIEAWILEEQVKERTITQIEKELMHDAGRIRAQRLRDKLQDEGMR